MPRSLGVGGWLGEGDCVSIVELDMGFANTSRYLSRGGILCNTLSSWCLVGIG